MSLTKTSFEKIYRDEVDAKTKERMLLVLKVVYHGKVSAHVAGDLHRNRAWACVWLKRYEKEGLGGVKGQAKSRQTVEAVERGYLQHKNNAKGKQPGLDNKTGGRVDRKEKWHQIPSHPHMPHTSQVGLQAEGAKKGACQHSIQGRERGFQKKAAQILVDRQQGRGRSRKVSP